jgi:2,4-dichlorophenol 6-monooxygenase
LEALFSIHSLLTRTADRTLITRVINPETPDGGTVIQMGPTWGRKSEEWAIHLSFSPNTIPALTEEALALTIRNLLKLPGLELNILKIADWSLERVVAHKYRYGHTFIAGDAAHRRPPTSGSGLNTSIEDANNLAFKLALVLSGKASPSFLNTYESERRQIGLRDADWAFFTFINLRVLQASVGLVPGATKLNRQRFASIFADTTFGRSSLQQIRRIMATQDIEFSAHNFELGFKYDGKRAAILSDGTEEPPSDALGQIYVPTTRPGHRLPHTWVESESGALVSTLDLIGGDDLLVITDEYGKAWIEAVGIITGLRIATAVIRTSLNVKGKGLYYDHHERWSKLREIKNGGAILVRPDNFVAWRSRGPSNDATKVLSETIQQLLGEGIGRNTPTVQV